MNELLIGIVARIISTLIVMLSQSMIKRHINFKKSKYSGKWKDEIYDDQGNTIKRNEYLLHHNRKDNSITGSLKRIEPDAQSYRVYKCSGVLVEGHLMLSIWSDDPIKSDGSVYARFTKDFTFEGKYLTEENNDVKITRIKLVKERI